jgi:hypothetical protein
MGLKKNNPGCNCCDTSTCINEDSTTFTGISIANCPTWTYDINGETLSSLDPNGTYLWSAVFNGPSGTPFCHTGLTPPTNYRLGTTYGPSQCCLAYWTSGNTTTDVDTGITFPYTHSGTNYTATIYARSVAKYELGLSFSVSKTSVGYNFFTRMNVCIYLDIPTARIGFTTIAGRQAYTHLIGSDLYAYVPIPGIGTSDNSTHCQYSRAIGYFTSGTISTPLSQTVSNISNLVVRPASLSCPSTTLSGSPFEIEYYKSIAGIWVRQSTASYTETSGVTASNETIDFELLT